jgi:WD repeat-containing protein 35
MFVYLSKKISIPNSVRIRSVAWNTDQGYIACGGENGLLKILKLDGPAPANAPAAAPAAADKKAPSGNLAMNQTLEGHTKGVVVVRWNDQFRKLTSSDENGVIMVWTMHRGQWYEEMNNNRGKSVVRDLCWNAEGQRVAIIYEDGAIVVGNLEGQRLWGQDLPVQLSKVTWSPDGRYLLLGTLNGEVQIHDGSAGALLSKLRIAAVDEGGDNPLASLTWHAGSAEHCGEVVPSLAVVYQTGRMQLMRGTSDGGSEHDPCGQRALEPRRHDACRLWYVEPDGEDD